MAKRTSSSSLYIPSEFTQEDLNNHERHTFDILNATDEEIATIIMTYQNSEAVKAANAASAASSSSISSRGPGSSISRHNTSTPASSSSSATSAGAADRQRGLRAWSLEGKVALVTGAGRGMGREMALELARHGAKVVVNYANSSGSAAEVVSLIKQMGSDAIAIRADVSRVSDIVSLFKQAKAHFERLDIVSSNSGVVSFGHLKDVTEEEYDRVMAINTRGQFFVAREAYKHLEVGGKIVLMGSITGQAKGVPRHATYSGSKGAIESFVRAMALDCGDKRITINCVAPGGIKTDMYHAVCREYIPGGSSLTDEQVDEYAATWSPLNRVGQPSDVARVVAFLATDAGGWMNGKVLGIDGGACM